MKDKRLVELFSRYVKSNSKVCQLFYNGNNNVADSLNEITTRGKIYVIDIRNIVLKEEINSKNIVLINSKFPPIPKQLENRLLDCIVIRDGVKDLFLFESDKTYPYRYAFNEMNRMLKYEGNLILIDENRFFIKRFKEAINEFFGYNYYIEEELNLLNGIAYKKSYEYLKNKSIDDVIDGI